MKKIITKICALILIFATLACIFACGESKNITIDGDYVLIVAESKKFEQGDTLKDYMDKLKEEGQFDFEMSNGMIMYMNGKSGGTNQYWMLYTDDADNSNEAWGTCEYDGKIFKSATLGAENLAIKDGCTYIWYLQTF